MLLLQVHRDTVHHQSSLGTPDLLMGLSEPVETSMLHATLALNKWIKMCQCVCVHDHGHRDG